MNTIFMEKHKIICIFVCLYNAEHGTISEFIALTFCRRLTSSSTGFLAHSFSFHFVH